MNWYFLFFFISGFCSVLYELVWLRLAMAQFGVTTAMVSIVLSVFMAGLGLGSWASGRWLRRPDTADAHPALRVYAGIEFLIGLSGIVVPGALDWGGQSLEAFRQLSSFAYYCAAGLWVAFTLVLWCALMGATVPVGMRAIRQTLPAESGRSFSYLYMANVAGAVAGTTVPLLLIEVLGFRGTLKVGVACNLLISASALALSLRPAKQASPPIPSAVLEDPAEPASADGGAKLLILLFLSGLTSMGMEVVWVRRYTPFLGTVVYAFASILAVYLLATLIGSFVYRRGSLLKVHDSSALWIWVASFALLPLVMASPHFRFPPFLRLAFGIAPFTGLLGFITPMLVDRFSGGNSTRAGKAYAINIVGCILGPLLAGFGLLPFISERAAMIVLTLPWLVIGLAPLFPPRKAEPRARGSIYAALALAALVVAAGKGFDEYKNQKVLRDSTATVIATGSGMQKQLLVNGYGMTNLTTITKVMAHLPLAFLDRPPQNALVICFGMGTTFRSLRSWGIAVTAVELVPSVSRMFSYYHSDADAVLRSPLSHVVIDDGRRYLERTREQYDVITIDPPPPLEAAASSLLYSEEFYRAARRRLRPGGILQQWVPTTSDSDAEDVAAITRSLRNSFPYVRAFTDEFGIHYLCSDRPLRDWKADDLMRHMPADAVNDLAEWEADDDSTGAATAAARLELQNLLSQELVVDELIASSPNTPALTDDRPINEYYAYRLLRHGKNPFNRDSE